MNLMSLLQFVFGILKRRGYGIVAYLYCLAFYSLSFGMVILCSYYIGIKRVHKWLKIDFDIVGIFLC
jgi:hypothetical protein